MASLREAGHSALGDLVEAAFAWLSSREQPGGIVSSSDIANAGESLRAWLRGQSAAAPSQALQDALPAVAAPLDYDSVPPRWALRFAQAPDLPSLFPGKFRPEFGPTFHRGRLDKTARLLVVGQDPSSDEQLARRAFVGDAGQVVQQLLTKAGVSESYIIVNAFHFGVRGQFDDVETISAQDPLLAWRNHVFDALRAENALQAVLTVGRAARDAVDRWPAASQLPRIHVHHPSARHFDDFASDWTAKMNEGLATLISTVSPDPHQTVDPTAFTSQQVGVAIPRLDLPFAVPSWHGATGDTRSFRAIDQGEHRIVWRAPT